ncbi:acid phosphatase type 7-like [Oppia nitens]|uniref:acid phosphatase type 7-like n=1 Tax=Oppia nitens TaxID=1686743 RepID=UPI0023DC0CFC|nr:acid phosphatase type 7-like [Oppia nitens]
MTVMEKSFEIFWLLLISTIITITDCKEHNYTNDRSLAIPTIKKISHQKQIHIAIGDNLSQMVIIWSERRQTNKTAVTYGVYKGEYSHIETGYSLLLKNDNKLQYIHYVTLKKLKSNTKYKYRVGSPQDWSEEHIFKTMRTDNQWVPRVVIFGDMGWIKGYSIPSLIEMTEKDAFDAVIHIGDIAYELYTFKGTLGDGFMRAIEPIASKIPYLVIPGNHEYWSARDHDYGYNYKRRFKMPQNNDNEFYTFTLGKALFVAFSTEFYFRIENGSNEKVRLQKRWLEQILTEANRPQNRAKHPWIIGLGHRSLYCSTTDADCVDGMTIDTGDTDTKILELEEILHRQGVDVTFWGHYHYYDRLYPVYKRIMDQSNTPYVNPFTTVHIISGAAGMDGDPEPEKFVDPPPPWSAFRTIKYGYSVMNIVNDTHVFIKQIQINHPEKPIDSIWIVQHNHTTRAPIG